jgi:hypothetical protein
MRLNVSTAGAIHHEACLAYVAFSITKRLDKY